MKQDKYWAIVWEMVDSADVVLEVVDARFPSICRSNRLERKIKDLDSASLIIALNKSDLVPREHLNAWIKWLDVNEQVYAIGVSATQRLGTSLIQREILRASRKKTAKVAVVGLPNTGKSTLINRLRGRKAASTAPIAGHTRGKQIIKVSNSITMFDTPGVIPVKLPEKHHYLLGITPLTKMKDPWTVAYLLYEQFNEIMPGKIAAHYEIEDNIDTFLISLAKKYNKIIKGGEPDEDAAAIIMIRDHIKGAIPIYEDINSPLRYQ